MQSARGDSVERYPTLFSITNTGAAATSGNLILTDQQGNPLSIGATLTDSSGITQPASSGSTFALAVPSGGTTLLLASGLTASSPVKVGWGRLETAGTSLSAVATYEKLVGETIQTVVGVLHSQPPQYATIPVDNNSSQGKQTAYAIADPGSQKIIVQLTLVSQDGSVVDDTVAVPLEAGKQVAR